ncbi:G8 domain-containing protein [Chitinophagaceae bacterium LB-8]|uniref:G8 domain-containing protein n=1 Tax=Paraflavisolibacter caeni TaxID=2982496 RepID=A0A9X2XTI0_9BACT|nr:G8 domain-containing protein [Paraflavisolibacter caeni]MCU7548057.1 G8 domain-containing protein [Paraflavisolibacter caeni]
MVKKSLYRKILFPVAIVISNLSFPISFCFAADITSAGNGNWQTSSTWIGGVVPQSGDNVFIQPGHTITVSVTSAINSITFLNTSSIQGQLTVSPGVVLNVTKGILLQNAASNSTNATIQGGGKIFCESVKVGSIIKDPIQVCSSTLTSTISELEISGDLIVRAEVNGNNLGHSLFYISSGSVMVKGTVILDADSDGGNRPTSCLSLNVSPGTGTLDLAGAIPFSMPGSGIVALYLNGSSSTIKYSRNGDQTIYTMDYKNLRLSGGGIKSVSGIFKINGTLTIDDGVTLNQATASITIPNNGSLVVNGTLDFTSPIGVIKPQGGMTKLTMGPNGYIRTINHGGLGRSSDASFERISTNVDWDLNSLSSNGTVEYYRSTAPTDGPINTQIVTDLDYNNLIISGTMQKSWMLGQNHTVNGNFTILTGAPLLLAGKYVLSIKGNWFNNGDQFTAGFGTISFNGTARQKVDGSSITTFNNLIIDNENGVELTQSANVYEVLTLNKGLLTIPVSKTLALTNFSSKEILGKPFSATKHIVTQVNNSGQMGILHVINIPANTSYLFPVGNGTYYLPATIIPSSSNDFGITVFKGITANGKPGFPLEEAQRKNVVNVVWDVTGTKNLATDISLSWPKGQNLEGTNVLTALENGTGLGISHFTNGNWDAPSGTFDAVNYTATRMNIATFSPFAVGIAGFDVLPVHFYNVRASKQSSGVEVEFTNLTESGIAYYDIERSVGGQIFYAVKRITPAKNDNGSASYTWIDNNNLEGKIVYRIKAVETSGKFIFSDSVSIRLEAKYSGMNVFAKDGQVSLQISDLPAGKYMCRILNTAGQVVSVEYINHGGGALTHLTLINLVKTGVYIYYIQGPVQMQKKFVMQ